MTAVVGILNKKAVAIAADSAVTTGSGKIFNKANKIFTLSKYHPIGIMIHNIDSFMGVPWETIIKMYRRELGDNEFDSVQEYKKDFIEFLRKKNFFSDDAQQLFKTTLFCVHQINHILFNQFTDSSGKFSLDKNDALNKERQAAAQYRTDIFKKRNPMPEFVKYSPKEFESYIETKIDEILKYPFGNEGATISDETKKLLIETYYYELIAEDYSNNYTGLVFVGYGKNEIFPSLVPIVVFFGFEKKLRYYDDTNKASAINDDFPSQISTFAQSDVMMTILTGIAPELQQAYNTNLKEIFKEQEKVILDKFAGDKVALKNLLDKIDKDALVTQYDGLMTDIITQKYITPLYEAVAGLGKEDLAEMAESLIYLTYLQRRITNAEESVGGDVDVAIISKGDGFIWIKRKHYFKPDLNPNFFKKYFK